MSDQEEKNSSHNDDEGNEGPADRQDENGENNEDDDNKNENENEINNNENGNEINNNALINSKEPFNYFEKTGGNCKCFSLENLENNIDIKFDDYKYCICVLMEDDSNESSLNLINTLTGLEINLKYLEENLEIEPQDICLFIFVKRTQNDKLFDDSDKENLNEQNKNFIIKDKTLEGEFKLKNTKIYIITNLNGLYEIRALKCYYSILKKLSKDKNMIFSTIITAGIFPINDSLLSLIKTAYNKKKNH